MDYTYVNVKTANYIDTDEVETIIDDDWRMLFMTEDADNNTMVFLDLSDDHIADLEEDYQYFMNETVHAEGVDMARINKHSARMCGNELILIRTLRKAGYTGTMLILISY